MIADGERLKGFLEKAQHRVLLCSPFIKARVLRILFSVVAESVHVTVVTRWSPDEVAAGVSDLETFDVVNERPNAELKLLDGLHAKLYLADDRCLVGSANLTGSALGWSERPNVEILVSTTHVDDDVVFLLKRLASAKAATFTIRSEVEAAAARIRAVKLDEGRELVGEDGDRRLPWLPRCAAPDRLYEIYQNPSTNVVVEGTREDALVDLRDLLIVSGLSGTEFSTLVQTTLLRMPAFARVIEKVPEGLTDTDGIGLVESSRPDLVGVDARDQWRIIRDWITVFFGDRFEVAAESFITRLKPQS